MNNKRKTKIGYILLAVSLAGCSSQSVATTTPTPSASVSTPSAVSTSLDSSLATEYETAYQNLKTTDRYSVGVKCTYEMTFENASTSTYDMDGVLKVSVDSSNQPIATMTQNIQSDGMESQMDGVYTAGRLYNTYNMVTYYEDMSFSDLKRNMLVPLDAGSFRTSELADIEKTEDENEVTYTLQLTPAAATAEFSSRYDINDLNTYDAFEVSEGTITQSFSKEGYLNRETANFKASIESSGMQVAIVYSSSASYVQQDTTTISIDADEQKTLSSYVSFQEIDLDAISDANLDDDRAESTVTATFQKRLVNRLGYTDNKDQTYTTDFNDGEQYMIDFEHSLFTYANRTSIYTYNWKGDTGGFGSSCSYNFDTGSSTSSCDADVLEMVKTVKTFLQMELYYCGLSLEDLVAEVNG